MIFINPVFLWGLLLAGLPLLIHLFGERHYTTFPFGSVRFIHEIRLESMRRTRILYWLILICRSFWLACLFLALSRPVFKDPVLRTPGTGICLIDSSYSQLILTDALSDYSELTNQGSFPEKLSFTERTSADSLFRQMMQNRKDRPEILYMVSDFQNNRQNRDVLLIADSLADSVICVRLPFKKNNAAISYLGSEKSQDEKIRLLIQCQRSDTTLMWPPVDIFVNGRKTGQARTDDSGLAVFTLDLPPEGSRISARIPDDSIDEDNIRYHVFHGDIRHNLLYVSDAPEKSYAYSAFQAMSAVNLIHIRPEKLAVEDLSGYDMIWFDDLYPIPGSQKKRLDQIAGKKPVYLSVRRPVTNDAVWQDVCGRIHPPETRAGFEKIDFTQKENTFAGSVIRNRFTTDRKDVTVLFGVTRRDPVIFSPRDSYYIINLSPFAFSYNEAGYSPYFTRYLNRFLDGRILSLKKDKLRGDPVYAAAGSYDIITPGGRRLHVRGRWHGTEEPGFYRIETRSDTQTVAVNIPGSELILDTISTALPVIALNVSTLPQILRLLQGRRLNEIFWFAAGVLFLCEMILMSAVTRKRKK